MPNMVILNITCILICLLLTSGQKINLYTYCPDLYGQDSKSSQALNQLYQGSFRSQISLLFHEINCLGTQILSFKPQSALPSFLKPLITPCVLTLSELCPAPTHSQIQSYKEGQWVLLNTYHYCFVLVLVFCLYSRLVQISINGNGMADPMASLLLQI